MKIYGIVAEYNPFHNGHRFHIEKTRSLGATHIVSVMSGNYVQRGDVAIADKFSRAKSAVENGADLVIELPTPYAMSSAETFAEGALSLLHGLGCVDGISFGCETPDKDALFAAAELSDEARNSEKLRELLKCGENYPTALTSIISEKSPSAGDILSFPNNLLAVEYIRCIIKKNYGFDVFCVGREGASHDGDEASGIFASASKVRKILRKCGDIRKFVPRGTFYPHLYSINELEKVILYRLRTMTSEELSELPDVSRDLACRVVNSVKTATDLDSLLEGIKTRRYPMARIRRVVLSALLGITSSDTDGEPPYARVLALNDRGAEILKKAKVNSTLPIGTSLAELSLASVRAKRFAELESTATDIYSLGCKDILPCSRDYTVKIEKTEINNEL